MLPSWLYFSINLFQQNPKIWLQLHFYRATLCISAVFAVARCPSVRPSVTLVHCIHWVMMSRWIIDVHLSQRENECSWMNYMWFIVDSDVADLLLVNPLPEDLFSYDNHIWSDYWYANYYVPECFCHVSQKMSVRFILWFKVAWTDLHAFWHNENHSFWMRAWFLTSPLLCCYTTWKYISSQISTFFYGWVALEKMTAGTTNRWPTNSSISWNFKYWLMCPCRTFLA